MKPVKTKSLRAAAAALCVAGLFGFSSSVLAQPAALPSAPTYPAGHVISIYNSSGTYTSVSGVNDFESWGGWNSAGLDPVGSGQVLSYFGVNYGGIGAFESNPQDVSGCTNLFMNVYSPNADSMAIRLVDTSGHSADITLTVASGVITDNSWLSLNFSLAQFQATTPALNLHSIQQIGLICNNPGEDAGNDYYIDNMIFVAATNVVPPPPVPTPTNAAATPTRNAASVVALYNSSGVYTDQQVDTWCASWSGATEGNFTLTNSTAVVLKYLGLQYAGVVIDNNYSRVLNVTNCNYMHVDVWTLNANQFGIQLVSTANGTQSGQVNFTPGSGTIVTNQWVGLDIPLTSFTSANANLDLSQISQMLWIDNQGGGGVTGGTFYIDNVYFYSNSVAPPPPPSPTNTAATPTRPSGGVLAIYNSSGVYTDSPVQDWDASWSSAGQSFYTITNTSAVVLRYGGLQYAGVEFGGADTINASGYNHMHVDVWTPNANQFAVQLVSLDNGGTQAGQVNFSPASGTIVSNHWVALDIPLSSFTAAQPTLDLTNLQQLLWVDNQTGGGVTGGIFYIDNVYFYNAATASSPTVSASVSSGNINITFPTQNGFTYTVQYSTNLTSGVWQTLNAVGGNNSVQSVPDSTTNGNRYYRLSIQ
jgi:hypothetical protein